MNRRSFMKGLAGVVAGVSTLSKAEEPLKAKVKDLCNGQNGTLCPRCKFNCKAEEPKEIELTAYGTTDKEYDLIADLVEEMNNFDKKLPDTKISYSLHCNYTGLAFLNDTGFSEKESDFFDYEYWVNKGYSHILWIPYKNWRTINPLKSEVFLPICVRPNLTMDIGLIAQYRKIKPYYPNEIPTFELVTTRCFNVVREEEGKKIAGVKLTCPRCKGDGHWHSTVGFHRENPIIKCPLCDGSGKVGKGKADLFRTYINEDGTKALEI